MLTTFLNDQYKDRLIFYLNTSSQLVPLFNFPPKPRSKIIYFLRKAIPSKLTNTNMSAALMIGDLLPNVLENLSVLCDEVMFPLLNNFVNQDGWTSVIVNDMKTESQDMRNAIAQMKGLVINRTILPLPISIQDVMDVAPGIAAGYVDLETPRHCYYSNF